MFGICLGHQILGLALGGSTHKLKFGHHGANQPGQDLATRKVAICAENHGYAVDAESLRAAGEPVEITHINLNDGTVEGHAELETIRNYRLDVGQAELFDEGAIHSLYRPEETRLLRVTGASLEKLVRRRYNAENKTVKEIGPVAADTDGP